DLLPVPFQRAGLWVESNHRVGVEVVALPVRAHKILSRIAGSVIDRICLALVGAGQPRSTAAVFAALAGPAFLVLFDSLELPQLFAAAGANTINLPGGRQLAGSRPEGQHVSRQHRERSEVAAMAVGEIGQEDLPHFLAGLLVKGDAAPVHSSDKHLAAAN